ncbi:MAG: outer membrane beta-barrel protein [Prolixibacteraceae bacterium]|jgi:hypothetical protein|nr:outer membrane beta-barrel protein [Prolixibacteraceae bacterium]
MNKRIALVLMILTAFTLGANSQNKMTLGVNAGYDYNAAYLVDIDGATNLNQIPDFNVGVDVGLEFGERIRARVELKYVNISFERDFDYSINDLDVSNTKFVANNINFNPRFDYRLFSIKNFDTYFTTGMRLEFTAGDYIRTYNNAGDKVDDLKYFGGGGRYVHKSAMAGVIGGFIFKYNVNSNLGITVSPEYTSFLTRFYEENDWAMQRANLNIGIEWTF